jgi:uncharacterized protein (TIGR02646 family)
MKKIIKQQDPKSLTQHRLQPNADYDNYTAKKKLRKSLLHEQGYICCYCMSRITKHRMKIEHWRSQTEYKSLQLDYKNLLGACMGNEGARPQNQHCDTSKGDHVITINPIDDDKNCESFVKYSSKGEIYSDDSSINHDLNRTLNLNLGFLTKNRKASLDRVVEQLNSKFPNKTWSKSALKKVLGKLDAKDANGYYSEYCQIAIAYLEGKLPN